MARCRRSRRTFSPSLVRLLEWADRHARLGVRANADTPEDAARAVRYGARGIGLCRTERMFNASDRLPIVIDMIVADTPEARRAAIDRLLPIQRADFAAIFRAMSPHPVTIRLLDPPIHEFLPTERQLEDDMARLHDLRRAARGLEVLVEAARTFGDRSGRKDDAGTAGPCGDRRDHRPQGRRSCARPARCAK